MLSHRADKAEETRTEGRRYVLAGGKIFVRSSPENEEARGDGDILYSGTCEPVN
jgi:hypothetical protein